MSQLDGKKQWVNAVVGVSWPVLLGAAACSALYVLILQGPLHTPFLLRYLASTPILYFESGLLFIGLAILILRSLELGTQASAFRRVKLAATEGNDLRAENAQLVGQLESLPLSLRSSYLVQRFHSALSFLARKGSTEGLDDELRRLADADAGKKHEAYGSVRVAAAAIPLLGVVGSLVGISKAIGSIDHKLLSTDTGAALRGLLAGLYVAFDATAVGIVMSMCLLLVMFVVHRFETQLLASVGLRVAEEIAPRFSASAEPPVPGYIRAVERMSNAVIKTTETLIKQQTDQWKAAIGETNERLGTIVQATGDQFRASLGESLDTSLKNHAERLARFEFEADQQMRARWDQWQAALADNVNIVREQQAEVTRQTEVLNKIVASTGEVVHLETSLNRNLDALTATRHFEDTVISLSAAIQLLSTRLSALPASAPAAESRAATQGRAA